MDSFIRWTGYLRTMVAFLIYVPGAAMVVLGVFLQSDFDKAKEAYELLFGDGA